MEVSFQLQEAQLLGHMVRLRLVLEETGKLSSKVAVPIVFPPSTIESSCCSISLLTFGLMGAFDFRHPSGCALVCHCFIVAIP